MVYIVWQEVTIAEIKMKILKNMKTLSLISNIIIAGIIIFVFSGCGGSSSTYDETATRGNINISVDESYQLIFQSQIEVFEATYEYAKINASYKPETDVFQDLIDDSARLIVTSRKLTNKEIEYFNSKQIIPRTNKIAYDAIAFIFNKENPDSTILFKHISSIFSGGINKWEQINTANKSGDVEIVFDNNKSSNPRYIREKFNIKGSFPENCFAVNSNKEVIEYVESNKNAIGILSVSWISDPNDTLSHRFLQKVKVVAIGDEDNDDGKGGFTLPLQGYIATGQYPLIREVYIISRETFSGLGTGFGSFVAGDRGQTIIKRAGLLPATMPIRLVKIKNQ